MTRRASIPLNERRGLTRSEAAAYVGLSDERFDRAVSEGIYTATLHGGRWDRHLLEPAAAWLDRDRVYFIAADVHVKIGYASRVSFRLIDLQCASPYELRLLGTMAGGAALETQIHKQFAHLRVRGEWFRLEPEIEDFIRENCW